MPLMVPAEALRSLRATPPGVPIMAYDAKAASDGQCHRGIERLSRLGAKFHGPKHPLRITREDDDEIHLRYIFEEKQDPEEWDLVRQGSLDSARNVVEVCQEAGASMMPQLLDTYL